MRIGLNFALVLAVVLISASARAEVLSLRGSSTFAELVFGDYIAEFQKETGMALNIVGNGSGAGLRDLMSGKADVAMVSGNLEDILDRDRKLFSGPFSLTALTTAKIGVTHLALIVNLSNPVKELTHAQVADILDGKITNWKEVGGEDLSILIVTEPPMGGLRMEFEKRFLSGRSIAATRRDMPIALMIRRVVVQNPGAVGLVCEDYLVPSVRAVAFEKEEEISLSLVTRGDPLPPTKRLIAAIRKYTRN